MEINESKSDAIDTIWFDESIDNEENQEYLELLNSISNCKGCKSLDEGFNEFYSNENGNEFKIIFVIVSGRLFGRYVQKLKENINKIINIPYTYVFTSSFFREILLQKEPDKEHILSYDTMISIKDGFYNPGGVYDDFDELLSEIKEKKLGPKIAIKPRLQQKLNYEGILTFEYLQSEEDLLAPALYKDIITNEKITKEDCKNFHKYILSFNDEELNGLFKNLNLFEYIPFEILSKYWIRGYTIESDFYKVLNNDLMKSKLPFNYKTFINMMYTGVSLNSIKSYPGKFLYRGSCINKKEIKKIKEYNKKGKLSTVVVFSKAFLSFSEDKTEAENFCGNSDETKMGCLYILENNNINLHESNADIQNFSVIPEEKEILFFPGSSFIIKKLKELDDDKIEITLNYNGKFKEKYSFIYEDQEKINNLIKNNIFTKNIAGKELRFLKGGRYLIEGKIAGGGFGCIYKGKDLEKDEIVAIKQIHKNDKESKEFFEKEVNIMKEISETIKYSVKYKDHFETQNYYYIIMDYYDNNLYEILFEYHKETKKKIPINLIKKIFKQLNITFKELLKNHIVHRDIKPHNILIKYVNEYKTNFDSVLADYGISEKYNEDSKLTRPCGTIHYMAPEVIKGEACHNNCDLYSIGVTLYELYWGEHLFLSMINKMFTLGEIVIRKIEEDLIFDDLVRKLLKINPKERITWEEYFTHPFFKQYEY